ncbi:hypothetical protein CSKR_100602 [Clonorchis sinensis]|uniref:Uncharacterized protein n=1 Tax=Clonorchis sinensis TaxID=79923 RepID=A0A8T1MK85_CLOSI|nr:hypothetical protein CSKR_100602 [Clonorchis sinensis]
MENVYQKMCSTAENMSDRVSDEVKRVNYKLRLNEGVLGVSDCLEILIKGDGDDRLSAAMQRDCGGKTSPLEDQDSNHLGDLRTNALISQAVQMNPVEIETNEKQFQTMRKRTESTLDKDTLTVVSLRVSSDSNSTLHSDTSKQVFPTEEDVQKQAVCFQLDSLINLSDFVNNKLCHGQMYSRDSSDH